MHTNPLECLGQIQPVVCNSHGFTNVGRQHTGGKFMFISGYIVARRNGTGSLANGVLWEKIR